MAAKALGVPLWQLLGGSPTPLDTYASEGLWLTAELGKLVAQGFRAVKMRSAATARALPWQPLAPSAMPSAPTSGSWPKPRLGRAARSASDGRAVLMAEMAKAARLRCGP